MKLDFAPVEVETSGKFKQANFSIGDNRVIFNMLRKKMYSRPIYVICQEIMSNSRDANREVGRGDIPVEVILPNSLSDQIQFKDAGPGISPDRMEHVYLCYGNSTKRDDNTQTGGFGMGAKTPFAYTDTFNIISVTKEADGSHKKRTYIAYIDDTQLGAVSLVSEKETDEPTGTTISMAVQPEHRKEFASAISNIGCFWTPRPEIKGDDRFSWPALVYSAQGTGWAITSSRPITAFNGAVINIDGIPYVASIDAIFPSGHAIHDDNDFHIMRSIISASSTVLFFSVGELQVTATREGLDYQPEVIEAIHNRLRLMISEARTTISDKIKHCTTLWDASIAWNNASSIFSQFGLNPKWNGMNLLDSRLDIYSMNDYDWHTRIHKFEAGKDAKVSVFERDPDDATNQSIRLAKVGYRRKSIIRHIDLRNDWKVLEDLSNTDKPDRARVLTVFINNPTIDKVAVVNMSQKGKDYLDKKVNWTHLGVETLDKFPKTKRTSVIKRGGYKIYKVKKLQKKGRAIEWISDPTKSTADATGGIYVVIKQDVLYMRGGKTISKEKVMEIQNLLGIEVHGFLSKWSRKDINPAWRSLWDVLKEKTEAAVAAPEVLHCIKYGTEGSIHGILPLTFLKGLKLHLLQEGPFKEWLKNSLLTTEYNGKLLMAQKLQSMMGLNPVDAKNGLLDWWRKYCLNRYPMLRHLSTRNVSVKAFDRDLINYVNSIDKKD